jgi:aldose 1-epimerase
MRCVSVLCAFVLVFLAGCEKREEGDTVAKPAKAAKGAATITKEAWGKTQDGAPVDLFTLTNAAGVKARITNYGGIVVSLKVPDKNGKFADVVLGLPTLDDYLKGHPSFGCIVGRYGNRIAKGKFTLNGKEYTLATNNGPNHLHGGLKGFDKKVWQAKAIESPDSPALELTYLSKDGEEGYPGNLSVKMTYTLTKKNELKIDYLATTDQDTVLNLTNHSYFNLAGEGVGDILDHEMTIAADNFTPTDNTSIPLGEIKPVKDTPFDFTKPMTIGARINDSHEQIVFGKGYDHNFVLNAKGGALALAARVRDPKTGRVLETYTTEPGVQLYTGNFLDGSKIGKSGKPYPRRSGFCLETQHFPDSPNQPTFPTTVLKPGQEYRQTTVYRFLAK